MGDDGQYHMYSALMARNCSLAAWLTNSRVLHSTSKALDEPFVPQGVVLGPNPNASAWDSLTQHNPAITRAPDGTWLLYYMGNNDPNATTRNCSSLQALPGPAKTQRVGLATSKSPSGPFVRRERPILEPGKAGSWDDLFTTNPSPFVFPNGSVLLIFKGRSREDSGAMYTGVARAASWDGPYEAVGTAPIHGVPTDCEDAGVFFSKELGRFFVIFHCGCSYLTAYSDDGLTAWKPWPAGIQPWCDITFSDGSRTVLKRRERPQAVLDGTGRLVGLTNGVEPPSSLHQGRVFTMLSTLTSDAE